MQLKVAELSDVDEILKLHIRYHIDTISSEDKEDGSLLLTLKREDLEALINNEQGVYIAKDESTVLAYLMVGSGDFWSRWGLFASFLFSFSIIEHLGERVTSEDCAIYGSACICKRLRGSGVLESLFEIARTKVQEDYSLIVTLLHQDNPRSYEAHQRKLGFKRMESFSFEEESYDSFIYDTSKEVTFPDFEKKEFYSGKPFVFLLNSPIEYIDYEDVTTPEFLKAIYADREKHYYWTDDFSAEFYVAQAKAGFIAVTMEHNNQILLAPEIQKSYALLDFKDLHIGKKVGKLLKKEKLTIEIGENLDEVAQAIKEYHGFTWLRKEYIETLKEINLFSSDCYVVSVVIRDKGRAVVGELGYIIGDTYTSLTGFSSKEKQYNNYGKAQLVLLAQYLEAEGFAFLNLGQPYMPYKLELGAKVYSREIFLERWFDAI